MHKPLETCLAIAGAVVWIGALPLAMAAFSKESCGSAGTMPMQERPGRADLNALEIHRYKLAACEKEGDEMNLRLLPRRVFVYRCMGRS